MKKITTVLGALLGALIFSSSSFADTSPRTVYTPARSEHSAPPVWYGAESNKKSTIYSTFNSDETNLYNCCNAWTLTTDGSELGFTQFVAMPFTPSAKGKLSSVQIALSYFAGTNDIIVSLAKDAGGIPGATIKSSFDITGVPPGGSCCTVEAIAPKGVKLKAGVTYWVVATVANDTFGGWNQDSTGQSGDWAFNTGSGWMPTSGTLGAFAVIAK